MSQGVASHAIALEPGWGIRTVTPLGTLREKEYHPGRARAASHCGRRVRHPGGGLRRNSSAVPAPNNGLELTASSVRCAPASGSSSGPAFGYTERNEQWVNHQDGSLVA
jgi:hypothetical protein